MAHFLIYRSPRCGDQPPGGFTEQLTKDQARTAFEVCLNRGHISPRNGRRLLITGPDYCIQPENFDDPLVTGEEGVKRALSPEEWQAYVGLTVAAALEA